MTYSIDLVKRMKSQDFFLFFFSLFPESLGQYAFSFVWGRSMSRSAVKQRHRLWPTMMGVSEGGQRKVLRRSGSGLFVGGERDPQAASAEFTKHKTTSSSSSSLKTVPTAPQPITACCYVCGESAPLCSQWETHSAKSSRRRRPAEVFQTGELKNTTALLWSGVRTLTSRWTLWVTFSCRFIRKSTLFKLYLCLFKLSVVILMLRKMSKVILIDSRQENSKKQIETLLFQNDEINLVNVFHPRTD